jgi:hypothetical protein
MRLIEATKNINLFWARASSSLAERNWSTYGFIHLVKHNKLGLQKDEGLVYVHPNFCLPSHRDPKYNSGPSKDWDVDPKSPDLNISLTELNLEEPRSQIGNTSSTHIPLLNVHLVLFFMMNMKMRMVTIRLYKLSSCFISMFIVHNSTRVAF